MLRKLNLVLALCFACLSVANAQESFSKTLSLQEAILLAVRENPNVQQSQLNHVLQKFSLEVERWQLQPHFNFQSTYTFTQATSAGNPQTTSQTAIQPQMTWNTPIGSEVTLTNTNNISGPGGNYNPGVSLQIIQHLMRGFGKAIVEAALYNAIDSERVSRLNVEGSLRTTITGVINAYLDVISAQNAVNIDNQALTRTQKSVSQTQMFIKAGRKAGVELITVQADVANAETRLEGDKNQLQQTRYALLAAIGIDPSTDVTFTNINVPALINLYHILPLEQVKQLSLSNDIQYQTDDITLHGATRRSVAVAEDNTRWQLDLTLNGSMGNGSGGGANAGLASLTNGYNKSRSAMLTLNIPIDDKNAAQALLNAKIALQQAELSLKQERWQKETTAINNWNTVISSKHALSLALNAEMLQGKTYNISVQKYTYGLIDSLELQTAQQQYTSTQQAALNAQINYLKALVSMDQAIGHTLQTWQIGVHYD